MTRAGECEHAATTALLLRTGRSAGWCRSCGAFRMPDDEWEQPAHCAATIARLEGERDAALAERDVGREQFDRVVARHIEGKRELRARAERAEGELREARAGLFDAHRIVASLIAKAGGSVTLSIGDLVTDGRVCREDNGFDLSITLSVRPDLSTTPPDEKGGEG